MCFSAKDTPQNGVANCQRKCFKSLLTRVEGSKKKSRKVKKSCLFLYCSEYIKGQVYNKSETKVDYNGW